MLLCGSGGVGEAKLEKLNISGSEKAHFESSPELLNPFLELGAFRDEEPEM